MERRGRVKDFGQAAYERVPMRRQMAMLARPLHLPWAVQRHLRFPGAITVRIDADSSFRMNTGSFVENDLFWRGFGRGWEALSLRVWAALAREARCILDIGSNVGIYSLVAQAVNEDARIIAFEPLARMRERLTANAELNGFDLTIEPLAVSDQTGTATLYDLPVDNFKRASLEQPETAGQQWRPNPIQAIRLDDYARDTGLREVSLIKIDIEGHEPAAFSGMAGVLEQWRPIILVEVLSTEVGERVWPMLEPIGYEAYRINERRGLVREPALVRRPGDDRNFLLVQPGALEKSGLSAAVRPGV